MTKPISSKERRVYSEKHRLRGRIQFKLFQVKSFDLISEACRPSSSIYDPLALRNYLKVAVVYHYDRRYSE